MIKQDISTLVGQAIRAAQTSGELPEISLPEIVVEHPARPEHGDYAVSVAMKLARAARQTPLKIAQLIKQNLPDASYISGVEAVAPGFVNFRLDEAWLKNQVDEILALGEKFGNVQVGNGERVQVEYVSANPTGPITIAGVRGACLGDTLANVLAAAGYDVEREYYVNDAGSRVADWYDSMWAYYRNELGQLPDPSVLKDLRYNAEPYAKALAAGEKDRFMSLPPDEARVLVGKEGIKSVLAENEQDLADLEVLFDVWFHEQALFDTGEVQNVIEVLRQNGHIAEREGATWFVSSALGHDRDNVLIRSNGLPTYFASDIAYHYNKLQKRSFNKVIDIWGADHQGHIGRMKAVLQALGLNPDALEILVVQMVSINGLTMSKSNKNFITLREVLNATGADPIRFNMIARSPEAHLDFNVNAAIEQNDENPVYYIQYAHARTAGIFRRADEQQIAYADAADLNLLGHESEMALIRQLLLLPEVVREAAASYDVQRLPYYTLEVARAFNAFYRDCLVLDPANLPLSQARLKLTKATQVTLARALTLMGMSAPETLTYPNEPENSAGEQA
jgi:arginyl-tRNA synthetase